MSGKWIVNVVWYDGTDAFVSKFLSNKTKEDENKIKEYLRGNGEVLKFDYIEEIDDLYNFIDKANNEEKCALNRYLNMH